LVRSSSEIAIRNDALMKREYLEIVEAPFS